MIQNIRLFLSNSEESLKQADNVQEKLTKNGFKVVEDDSFELGIAIGGDGAFLRMIHDTNFDSNKYYVGINTGHLGFLQDIKPDEIDQFIEELKEKKYMIDDIGIQETTIGHENGITKFYSLNEITVREQKLDLLSMDLYIDDEFLESYKGDGILIATSIGSTAYNLSYGGSIVYPSFSTLQITPMAPLNSIAYRSLINSVIIPENKVVKIEPKKPNIILTVDGENNYFECVTTITSSIVNKTIKILRFSHYNFPKKINEKFLS